MKEEAWPSFITAVIVVTLVFRVQANNLTAEAALIAHLTTNYDPRARPRFNASETVDVKFAFYLTRLDELNMRSETFSLTGWMTLRWHDELLTWNPSEHNNVNKVVLPSSSVWVPMIAVDNSVVDIVESNFREDFLVVVHHTGLVSWEPAGVFTTSCSLELSFYPFDHQTCEMFFSTWDYTQDLVNLTSASASVNMDAYIEHGEWSIVHTLVTDGTFSHSPAAIYREVVVSIHMQRKALYYFINILIPCLMMSGLVLMVFYLPPDSGEKVSLGVTVLLAFSVFQLMIAEDMPTSASAIPILEIYLLCFMTASVFSIIISVLVLNLHHRTEYTPPPAWLRRLVLDHFGYWLCMHTRRGANAVMPVASDCNERVEAKFDIELGTRSSHLDAGGGQIHTDSSVGLAHTYPGSGQAHTEQGGGQTHTDQGHTRVEHVRETSPTESGMGPTHLEPGPSFPKIVLPASPSTVSRDVFTKSSTALLGRSSQNLTLGAAKSTARLIQSIAAVDRTSTQESKTAFLSAVKDVYQELYQTRRAGEVEAALENEWKLIARVVDRIFFWITFIILIVSSAVIFGIVPNSEQHLAGKLTSS